MTLNRADLVQRLQKLAASKKPRNLSEGAMCYARGAPDPEVEIPCPQCQEGNLTIRGSVLKKLYPKDCDRDDSFHKVREKILKRLAKEPDFLKKLKPIDRVHCVLASYQEPFATLQELGLPAELIIPSHGSLCGRGFEEKKFALQITYPDSAKPKKIVLGDADDLEHMVLFLEDVDRYRWGHGREGALKELLPELRKLFGITKSECEGV